MSEPKIHYKHDHNMTDAPLCGLPPWYDGTLKVENVTCKRCLKKLEEMRP